MKLLDSSIWLDHLADTNEKSSETILSEELLFCSILTLFEVKKRLIKLGFTETKINNSIEFIKNRAVIININENIINYAVGVSIKHKLSAIDSMIYASAINTNAKLITADNDFRNLENIEII